MVEPHYNSTEIAAYINVVSNIRYWEAVFIDAEKSNDAFNTKNAAKYIKIGLKEYHQIVPEEIRKLVKINVSGLETLCSSV